MRLDVFSATIEEPTTARKINKEQSSEFFQKQFPL